jgi:hypothetical protein
MVVRREDGSRVTVPAWWRALAWRNPHEQRHLHVDDRREHLG